jgi:hypothetical protein
MAKKVNPLNKKKAIRKMRPVVKKNPDGSTESHKMELSDFNDAAEMDNTNSTVNVETFKLIKEKPLLKPIDVQIVWGISRTSETEWRKKGWLPEPDIIGRYVYYPSLDEIIEYRKNLKEGSHVP